MLTPHNFSGDYAVSLVKLTTHDKNRVKALKILLKDVVVCDGIF